ncbi:hypothetical protein GPECTOR_30g274 [Gonium pectorale]|uniref:Protein kinase domain-containing protein n=1 Tax=Gonium pectorale TaxID=33097 RepID=A0A150GED8_GONPE|nr:hypothetical protein GPECTOR_30g274 [Gonium pectorale]|eukprot:KXZ48178.1 hypothetical protein GPECTOR_30g274 [Gonium pectorale]
MVDFGCRPELEDLDLAASPFVGPTAPTGASSTVTLNIDAGPDSTGLGAGLAAGPSGSGVQLGRQSQGSSSYRPCSTLRFGSFAHLAEAVVSPRWAGHGAHGAVVNAQWRSGCTVAVKWLVTDAADVPAAYLEALLAKMMAHPFLVQTFEAAICQLDDAWDQVELRCSPRLAPGAPAPAAPGAAAADAGCPPPRVEDELSVPAVVMDSFEGRRDPPESAGQRPVDCVGVLRQLGAAPGKYVVQIVSEWCDEGTLHAAIRGGVFRPAPPARSRTWALRALLRTAREVALGMCHLHSLGVIHGDLKPGNVLLKSSRVDSRGFVAKVADFGLSRLLRGPGEQYVATEEWATVPYMAGEYLDNRLCKSSDVYSFGVLLWQMYTGKKPFAEHLEAQVAVGVMLGNLSLEWPAGMPPPLLRLGQACCRHDPDQRPTFKEVAVALAGIETEVKQLHAAAKTRSAYRDVRPALPPLLALQPRRQLAVPAALEQYQQQQRQEQQAAPAPPWQSTGWVAPPSVTSAPAAAAAAAARPECGSSAVASGAPAPADLSEQLRSFSLGRPTAAAAESLPPRFFTDGGSPPTAANGTSPYGVPYGTSPYGAPLGSSAAVLPYMPMVTTAAGVDAEAAATPSWGRHSWVSAPMGMSAPLPPAMPVPLPVPSPEMFRCPSGGGAGLLSRVPLPPPPGCSPFTTEAAGVSSRSAALPTPTAVAYVSTRPSHASAAMLGAAPALGSCRRPSADAALYAGSAAAAYAAAAGAPWRPVSAGFAHGHMAAAAPPPYYETAANRCAANPDVCWWGEAGRMELLFVASSLGAGGGGYIPNSGPFSVDEDGSSCCGGAGGGGGDSKAANVAGWGLPRVWSTPRESAAAAAAAVVEAGVVPAPAPPPAGGGEASLADGGRGGGGSACSLSSCSSGSRSHGVVTCGSCTGCGGASAAGAGGWQYGPYGGRVSTSGSSGLAAMPHVGSRRISLGPLLTLVPEDYHAELEAAAAAAAGSGEGYGYGALQRSA